MNVSDPPAAAAVWVTERHPSKGDPMSSSRVLFFLAIACAWALPAMGRAEVSQGAAAAKPDPATSGAPAAPPSAPAAASEPFAWGDFTWMTGNNRQKEALLEGKYFTGTFTADVNYNLSFNHPIDHTNVGSTATFREGEINLSFLAVGGDLHYKNVRGRVVLQLGTRATGVPRNDFSPDRGQFNLRDAYRYVSEAYGGYHWDVWHGVNLDVGIFLSYIGLYSYNNFENWSYQPSFTSDNTPWFFHGARLQTFPTDRLKVELWLINGWQTYGMFNEMPGLGSQILYRPVESVAIVSNLYVGRDTIAYNRSCTGSTNATAPNTATCNAVTPVPSSSASRLRFHTDNSFLHRYYNNPGGVLSKAAFSITGDLGFESGGGVTPFGHIDASLTTSGQAADTGQNFISGMAYHRLWFFDDLFGWTVGGGYMHNPGRYLVLAPTGNANPVTGGFPFTLNPGDTFNAWDISTALQYMPHQFSTWGIEFVHRHSSVPYFAGGGGVTSATGTWPGGGFDPTYKPDLVQTENRLIFYMLVRV
jgi:hypothetical protein